MPKSLQKLDIMDAIQMHIQGGLSYREIERVTGFNHATIHNRVKKVMSMFDANKVVEYEEHKADILSGVERVILSDMLDEEKRKKATWGNLAYGLKNVNEMNRLKRGESTSNISYMDLNRAFEQVQEQRARLELELGLGISVSDNDEHNPQ